MKEIYKIVDFSHAELYPYFYPYKPNSYSNYSSTFFEQPFHKVSYLYSYLNLLGAKYVLIENEYLSEDFTRDYSLYYNSSFTNWQKTCNRLHFFRSSKDLINFEKTFKAHLLKSSSKSSASFWQNDYLGCIVIKPIPVSSVGYTLLKHYNYSHERPLFNDNRRYFATRLYKIHLFGHEIEIDTLTFQEQDSMVAACATMCVWFLQQKGLITNLVVRKSPGEITKDAGDLLDKGERLFPNSGLKVPELCRAIQKNGLDPLVRNDKDKRVDEFPSYLKRCVYAYQGIKLPIILITKDITSTSTYVEQKELLHAADSKENSVLESSNGQKESVTQSIESRHAVAICGFRVFDSSAINLASINSRESLFYADYVVEKLFVHDDQFGPFASLDISERDDKYNVFYQHRTEFVENSKIETKNFKPDTLIIPLLPKVKITYDQIEPIISTFNSLYGLFFGSTYEDGKEIWAKVLWDIKLCFSDEYKEQIRVDENISSTIKLDVLTRNLPKLVWVVNALYCDEISENNLGYQMPIINIVFDAGGLVNSMLCVNKYFYFRQIEKDFLSWLKDKLNDKDFLEEFEVIDIYLKFLSGEA